MWGIHTDVKFQEQRGVMMLVWAKERDIVQGYKEGKIISKRVRETFGKQDLLYYTDKFLSLRGIYDNRNLWFLA